WNLRKPQYRCREVTHAVLAVVSYNFTSTTENYTLSLHDALPIYNLRVEREDHVLDFPAHRAVRVQLGDARLIEQDNQGAAQQLRDRKSTRLNSSHDQSSYAVFCLKKKMVTGLKSE